MRFLYGQCVRSNYSGFGYVVVGGTNPVVQFHNGSKRQPLADEQLTPVSYEQYESHARHMESVEALIDLRMYGCVQSRSSPMPPKVSLVEALEMTERQLPPGYMEQERPDGALFFIASDLNQETKSRDAGDSTGFRSDSVASTAASSVLGRCLRSRNS